MSRIVIDDDVETGDPEEQAVMEFLLRDDYRGRCPVCGSPDVDSAVRGDEPPKLCWGLCNNCDWRVEIPGHCAMFFESPPWKPDFR